MNAAKRNAVEIHQVGNGFYVRPPYDVRRGEDTECSEVLVFQTFAGLVDWLGSHFTHRQSEVKGD